MRGISAKVNIPLGSIHNICNTPTTPPKRMGRARLINTPTRKQLVDFIQQSAINRRMTLSEVAYHCGMLLLYF